MTNGISPDCSYALGSGPVTLNSGATLQFENASPTNALTLNGGTLYAANSAGVTWMGPVTVNSNTTVRTDYGMGISGNISGAGGLTKTGTNTLTLSGVNTYTGATLVQTGTLACSTSASLGGGALSISNGAVVNLNYSGTRSIFSLTLGGTNKLAGVYGSTSSPATYQDAHFSGTGTVTVPVPISITNLPATGIATNQATLNASLGMTLAYGGTNATVLAYWGTANGGTNPAAWANSAYVGKWTNVVSTNIAYTATGLAMNTNTTYYFAFLATNAVYTVWATNVLSFTAADEAGFHVGAGLSPGGISVQRDRAGAGCQRQTAECDERYDGAIEQELRLRDAERDAQWHDCQWEQQRGDLGAGLFGGGHDDFDGHGELRDEPGGRGQSADHVHAARLDVGRQWHRDRSERWRRRLDQHHQYLVERHDERELGRQLQCPVRLGRRGWNHHPGRGHRQPGHVHQLQRHLHAEWRHPDGGEQSDRRQFGGLRGARLHIGGTGGVTMNSSGSLRLYGLSPNTYSGGTIINRGTLIWGTMVNGISPECNYALGTGPVTLNSGATLEFERASPTNALILNGGTFLVPERLGCYLAGAGHRQFEHHPPRGLAPELHRQHQRARRLHQDRQLDCDPVRQ